MKTSLKPTLKLLAKLAAAVGTIGAGTWAINGVSSTLRIEAASPTHSPGAQVIQSDGNGNRVNSPTTVVNNNVTNIIQGESAPTAATAAKRPELPPEKCPEPLSEEALPKCLFSLIWVLDPAQMEEIKNQKARCEFEREEKVKRRDRLVQQCLDRNLKRQLSSS